MGGRKEKRLQAKGIWTVREHIYIQCGTIHVSHTKVGPALALRNAAILPYDKTFTHDMDTSLN